MMNFPDAEMIDLGEIELEVFQAGQGGMPVVLAHGWPEHAFSWRFQVPALVAAGYHVIVPNQRGYGRSSQPADVDAYACRALTGDYNRLLDTCRCSNDGVHGQTHSQPGAGRVWL